MKRRLTTFLPVLLAAIIIFTTGTKAYADDISNHYHKEYLLEMVEKGIMNGYGDGVYKPDDHVTRGQFATMLTRALQLKAPTNPTLFKDVNPDANEIYAAAHAGIITGYSDGTFKPTQNISRQHIAVMIDRARQVEGLPTKSGSLTFKDTNLILKEYHPAIGNILNYGIMTGSVKADGVYFRPADHATRGDAAKVISVLLSIMDKQPTPSPTPTPTPNPEPEPEPKPEPPVVLPEKFQIATIENKKWVKLDKQYDTYDQALQAFTANANVQGLFKGNELYRIKNGIAFAQGPAGQTTIIYGTPSFTNQLTYIEAGREMRILEYAEDYVKVQVADTVGYVKHSQIDFTPTVINDSRDYYTANNNNELIHLIYNSLSKTYASYSIGPAPDKIVKNIRYYSADGVHFTDGAGKPVVTHHPYFQFQSIRTKTNYTAEELDAQIMRMLQEREATGNARYKNATTESKLIGLGAYLKQMEQEQRVNALFILATAVHESDYGMSTNAKGKNNLFGIKVFDSHPELGEVYATPQRSVEAFVKEYMNKNYAMPAGSFAKGAVPGNKTAGFNAHYASDPTWGSKIAGHMWRIDRAMGSKDYGVHKLAMTNQSGKLNVRTGPTTQQSILFTYKPRDLGRSGETGYPVVIVGEQKGADGYTWYQVISDDMKLDANGNVIEHGWIRGDLLKMISQ